MFPSNSPKMLKMVPEIFYSFFVVVLRSFSQISCSVSPEMEDKIHFLCFCPKYFTLRNEFLTQKQSPFHNLPSAVTLLEPGDKTDELRR